MPLPRLLQPFQVDPVKIPLRWLLVIPFVLQTVGATAIVGYFAYRSGQRAVENLAYQLLQQTSARVSDRLTSFLQPSQQVTATNRLLVEQGTLNLSHHEQLRQHLWQQMLVNPSLLGNGFWSEAGSGTNYLKMSSEAARQLSEQVSQQPIPPNTILLSEIKPNRRQFFGIDAQGRAGKLLYQIQDDFRTVTWYRHAKNLSHQGWTPVSLARIIPLLQTLAIAPVYNAAGKLQGFFVANYFLSEISLFLNQMQFSPSGQVFIMERSGELVATSIKAEASCLRQFNGKPTRIAAVNSQDLRIRAVAQHLLQRFGRSHQLQTPQQLSLMIQEQRQFVQVTPYQDGYGLDWLVVTVVPESDFMAEIQVQTGWTIVLCWGTLFATIALGLFVAKRITDPLQQLNCLARQISQNHLAPQIRVSGLGEVRQLAQTFQQMAEQMQLSWQLRRHYEQELQQQVAERTAELAQVKDLWEAIFSESADALFLVDSTSTARILDCNQRAVELFEVASKAELVGMRGSMLQKQPYTDAEMAEIMATLTQIGVWSREIEYVTKTGQTFWGNLAIKPISVAGQTIQLVRLTDISDRKTTETALQHYERIVSATTDGIALVDRNYCYQIVNQTYLKWHNQSITGVVGHSISDILGETIFQTVVRSQFDRCLAGETIEYSGWFNLPSLGRQFLSVTYVPYLDVDQSISGVVVSLRNITPLKQAELALRQSEQKFRGAFDTISTGMALVSPAGGFLEVNTALCQMLGYSEVELLQRRLEDIEHPDDRRNTDWVEPLFAGQASAYQTEQRFLTKHGQTLWGLMNLAVMQDAQTSSLYLIVQIANISDRHKLDEMKDEFISVVSHELRTPLTSIRGSLGILETGILSDEPDTAQRMLQVALKSTDRLVRLVNDILTLERLESGKVPLELETCAVSDLMEQAIESVCLLSDSANITLDWTPVSALVNVVPDAIVQTLTNLLSNAIKFSLATSTVWLTATVVEQEQANQGLADSPALPSSPHLPTPPPYVLFAIVDQGRGIPADKLESIFGRFQQVDSSDSRQRGGTGLGLAISKSIVEQHHGQIWAESVLGQGSTFYFTLPFIQSGNTFD
ncbi:PAS domain S-box protein [Pantanalinema sp. GBBB05]|uniref:PAS domain S-box protein n=1 Tax=Pantanalinema sp. GBBB05 TaxID=2604139 RepID=UPI001D966A62|nr:PAS domain S-box protein [Pantanalinema sp. GBBB05]